MHWSLTNKKLATVKIAVAFLVEFLNKINNFWLKLLIEQKNWFMYEKTGKPLIFLNNVVKLA